MATDVKGWQSLPIPASADGSADPVGPRQINDSSPRDPKQGEKGKSINVIKIINVF